jgi:hypothetical protein
LGTADKTPRGQTSKAERPFANHAVLGYHVIDITLDNVGEVGLIILSTIFIPLPSCFNPCLTTSHCN